MNSAQMGVLLRHIRILAADRNAGAPLDGELLERFSASRDEEAFAGLVQRHGPMVWSVCRHVLHNWHDAEDVFQATFLVLARKASSIHRPESLASWLYGVAYHLAVKAQARSARQKAASGGMLSRPDSNSTGTADESRAAKAWHARTHLENRRQDMASADPLLDMTWRELRTTLYEELSRLPEKNRTPLVLCYLQGKTQGEAARLLGWTKETVRGRLDRGREQLRKRLTRRGLALTSALFSTLLAHDQALAVPASLLKTTVKGATLMVAGQVAAGAISNKVTALASGGLKDLFVSKLKITMAVLLAVGTASTGAGIIGLQALAGPQRDRETRRQGDREISSKRSFASLSVLDEQSSRKQEAAPSDRPKDEAKDADQEKITVSGRVIDSNGKPVGNADVAVVGWAKRPLRSLSQGAMPGQIMGQRKADADGHFTLSVPRSSKEAFWDIVLLARTEGYALGWQHIDADANQSGLEIRLAKEQILRGRLVDLQAQPAAGARVQVAWIVMETSEGKPPRTGSPTPLQLRSVLQAGGLACWPKPATTDDQGRFTLHGLASKWRLTLEVDGDQFARQEFDIKPEDIDKGKEVTRALAPARILEGDVTYADTGKPVPNARLVIQSQKAVYDFNPIRWLESRTDENGRFHVIPHPGNYFAVHAYPPAGEPYLMVWKELDWPKANVVKQDVHLALPRGIAVRGIVTEVPSGKPVPGARVDFQPFHDNNPFYRGDVIPRFRDELVNTALTSAEGKFQMTVLPGPGHLLINGPTLDYLHAETTLKELYGAGIGPNFRQHPDALVALNLKQDAGTHDVAVTLRRGVTLKGNVVGPDGKPVAEAVMICRSYIPYGYDLNGVRTKEIKEGRFELPGCDPEKTSEVFFFDVKNRLAKLAKLSGKQAGEAVTVQLQPCGEAKARFVDEQGKAIANSEFHVEVVIGAGVHFADFNFDSKGPTAETVQMSTLDPDSHLHLHSDAQGRVTFRSLIPDASYLIVRHHPFTNLHKEFKVEPGKTLDLGDITVKPRKRGG